MLDKFYKTSRNQNYRVQLLDVEVAGTKGVLMTQNQISYWNLVENSRSNRMNEGLKRYANAEGKRHNLQQEEIDRTKANQTYELGLSEVEQREKASIRSSEASKYAADKSAEASMYSADRNLKGTKYSADTNYKSNKYSADTNRKNTKDTNRSREKIAKGQNKTSIATTTMQTGTSSKNTAAQIASNEKIAKQKNKTDKRNTDVQSKTSRENTKLTTNTSRELKTMDQSFAKWMDNNSQSTKLKAREVVSNEAKNKSQTDLNKSAENLNTWRSLILQEDWKNAQRTGKKIEKEIDKMEKDMKNNDRDFYYKVGKDIISGMRDSIKAGKDVIGLFQMLGG